ncbi:MAG: hypothetical protein C6I00_00150 [Nitratiruptor sp.]|nr:hypothetical protein [Nitratiruptor sp.]NPA83656.1 hypothetical protein [Campylobacterota bacterium]
MVKGLLLFLLALNLIAADRVDEIVSQLKALSGKELAPVVLFVKYGPDRFDWLALSPDGKLAAKLEGMEPDGSFRYTILGDPAQYGLHFQISLNRVVVETLEGDEGCPECIASSQDQDRVQEATTAVTTFVVNPTLFQGTTPVRSLQRGVALTLLPPKELMQSRLIRATYTHPCAGGGSIEIRINESQTAATFRYSSCITQQGVQLDGILQLETTDGVTFQGSYKDFTVSIYPLETHIPFAVVSYTYNDQGLLDPFLFQAPTTTITDLAQGYTIQVKDYTLRIQELPDHSLLWVEGDYRPECKRVWRKVETVAPIVLPNDNFCPQGGMIEIDNPEDGGQSRVAFTREGGIEVLDQEGRVLATYGSCLDLPKVDPCP